MEKKTQEGAPEGAEGSKRRRRYSAEEKLRLVAECEAPGSSVSLVACKYGISSSLLFRWRQLKESGGVSGLQAGEAVVPESEVQALKAQVRELQRLLGKKTQEAEILRDAVELAREKNYCRPRPCPSWEAFCERGGSGPRGRPFHAAPPPFPSAAPPPRRPG